MPTMQSISASTTGDVIRTNIPQLQEWLKVYVKTRNQTVYESVLEKMINIAKKAWKNT